MFETILGLVIGAVLGAVIGFLYAKNRYGSDSNAAERELENQQLSQQLHDVQSEHARITEQYEQTRMALGNERENTAKLNGQLQGAREQLDFVQEQLERVQDAEKQRIEHERQQAQEREEERLRAQEENLQEESRVLKALSPVQKNLDLLQQKVTEIEESRQSQMGKLSEQLLGLGDAQKKLDQETTNLAMALRNNKVRGAWGEAQLKNIVESAGLREHVDFETQYYVENEDGQQQRPDMVVMLPDGKFIPIDAKVPYSDYQRAMAISDAASEQELHLREEYFANHAKALRGHIDVLGKREYWKNSGNRVAPDFVIAFIPNESLLQAALDTDPTILDYAFNKQVALTTPVTLWSVLKSVAFAWQQQTLSDEAQQLFDLSREMFKRLSTMSQHASKLGKSLGTTVQNYNAFVGSLQSQVVPTARKLNSLEPGKVFDEPVPLEEEKKSDIREITAPELLPDFDD
ncbi:DNA recombination protein RmuC [Alloscardovia theropitheci]|uniref:DNA recombination protein RmuC n=1 Tax=Alloscardovia theropitheci TaxID=2496842 RepID=A0A4V2MTU6_9BIFI|nr:DNA recombination protein RmuC [Alloscardovia theropitheci]TCD53839.1 DNA recombination protein RmuC [Alloscardovia theropitheci]